MADPSSSDHKNASVDMSRGERERRRWEEEDASVGMEKVAAGGSLSLLFFAGGAKNEDEVDRSQFIPPDFSPLSLFFLTHFQSPPYIFSFSLLFPGKKKRRQNTLRRKAGRGGGGRGGGRGKPLGRGAIAERGRRGKIYFSSFLLLLPRPHPQFSLPFSRTIRHVSFALPPPRRTHLVLLLLLWR